MGNGSPTSPSPGASVAHSPSDTLALGFPSSLAWRLQASVGVHRHNISMATTTATLTSPRVERVVLVIDSWVFALYEGEGPQEVLLHLHSLSLHREEGSLSIVSFPAHDHN